MNVASLYIYKIQQKYCLLKKNLKVFLCTLTKLGTTSKPNFEILTVKRRNLTPRAVLLPDRKKIKIDSNPPGEN